MKTIASKLIDEVVSNKDIDIVLEQYTDPIALWEKVFDNATFTQKEREIMNLIPLIRKGDRELSLEEFNWLNNAAVEIYNKEKKSLKSALSKLASVLPRDIVSKSDAYKTMNKELPG